MASLVRTQKVSRKDAIENELSKLAREVTRAERKSLTRTGDPAQPQFSITNDAIKESATRLCKHIEKMPKDEKIELNPTQHQLLMMHSGMSPKELANISKHFVGDHNIPDTTKGAQEELQQMRSADAMRVSVGIEGPMAKQLFAELSKEDIRIPKSAKPAFEALQKMVEAESPEEMGKAWKSFQECEPKAKTALKVLTTTTAEKLIKEQQIQEQEAVKKCTKSLESADCAIPESTEREYFQRLKRMQESGKEEDKELATKILNNTLQDADKHKVGELNQKIQSSIKVAHEGVQKAWGNNALKIDDQMSKDIYALISRDAERGVPNAQAWKDIIDQGKLDQVPDAAKQAMVEKIKSLKHEVEQGRETQKGIDAVHHQANSQGVGMQDSIARVVVAKDVEPGKTADELKNQHDKAAKTIATVAVVAKQAGRDISQSIASRMYEQIANDAKAGKPGAETLLDKIDRAAAAPDHEKKFPRIPEQTLDTMILKAQREEIASPSRSEPVKLSTEAKERSSSLSLEEQAAKMGANLTKQAESTRAKGDKGGDAARSEAATGVDKAEQKGR